MYVYSTSQPIFTFILRHVQGSEYILHCMLEFAITSTDIKSIG